MLSACAHELRCVCGCVCVCVERVYWQADNTGRANVYDLAGFIQFHMHVTGRCLDVSGM